MSKFRVFADAFLDSVFFFIVNLIYLFMKNKHLFLTSALTLLLGTTITTAQSMDGTPPTKKEALPTTNPETGARIVYYIPGQPVSSGAELGIDVIIEYRVMPGYQDPATLTDEQKHQREVEMKKAYYESQGLQWEDGSKSESTPVKQSEMDSKKAAKLEESKTVSPK
jgi:hypothetical protein